MKLSTKLAELKSDGEFTSSIWFEKNDPEEGYVSAYVLVHIAPVPLAGVGIARSRKNALQFAYENLAKMVKKQD